MAPPLNRTPMAPRPWSGRAHAHEKAAPTVGPVPALHHWHRTAAVRRICLLTLVLVQTWIATDFMASVLPYQGRQPVEIAILILFAILFGWISAGFWTAMMGFLVLWTRHDHYAISATAAPDTRLDETARTAVVMPVYNENVARVFAGLRATYESLARTPATRCFDFYILSDSNDPDTALPSRMRGTSYARLSVASDTFSTAAGSTALSARAATSPTSAAAGEKIIGT